MKQTLLGFFIYSTLLRDRDVMCVYVLCKRGGKKERKRRREKIKMSRNTIEIPIEFACFY